MKKFVSTERKGFHMTFENGLTVSVQWGYENYCDNKTYTIEEFNTIDWNNITDMSSNTAEVAVIFDNKMIPLNLIDQTESYHYKGYLSPEEVLEFMNKVSSIDKDYIFRKLNTTIYPYKKVK